MIRTGRSSSKAALLASVFAAAAILAAGSSARAQTCPTGASVPQQTIKIYNDSNQYIFAELEVGTNGPDQWIQMACNITQTQAKTFTYAETFNNRFYINGDKGIPPNGSVVITLPLYTQLAASVDPTQPNQYAEWWQGQNMQIFASPTATPPLAFENAFRGKARPDQKPLTSAVGNPTWPTCVDQTGAACPLNFFYDDGTLPKYGPSQLVEATLGATQVQKVVNDSLPISLNVTQADFDVSYVNVAYMAAAMGPYKNNQSGYVGSDMAPVGVQKNPGFQLILEQFQQKFNWPRFIDLDGTKAAIPKLPSTLELVARLSGDLAPADLPPVTNWPSDVWPPIQQIRANWANFSTTCKHSAAGFTTFCDAILDVRDLIAANYAQYIAIFPTKCNGTPVTNTPDRILAHVYGWAPWIEAATVDGKVSGTGCGAAVNLLENTPGYSADHYALYGKVKLEFDQLNYGIYTDKPSYPFNPWAQFIHGQKGSQTPYQLGIPGVYAYSVDDAVGNLNVEAQGYIVDIGSLQHLENKLPASPPVNISLGYASTDPVRFVTYGVCGNDPSQQKPVNPANPQFIISANAPQKCPVYLTDNKSPAQTYTFTVTAAPPFTLIPSADVAKNPSQAVWSSGNGNPTQYNTTRIIQCGGNNGAAPNQSSKAWCCTLLPGSGTGVFAYSTPEIPPTAHQSLLHVVVTNPAMISSTSDLRTCNGGK